MDTETVPAEAAAATTSTKCSQQFLVAQAGFKRRISSIVSEVVEPGQGHAGGYGAVSAIQGPTFDNRMASMTGASEVLCHGTGSSSSPVTSAYSAAADHHISYSELRPGGSGLWSTSAASGMTFEGLRGPVEPPASGWSQGSTINAAPAGLIRHSSLPVTGGSSRASRGTATHPRSIAERVRRGKISERMKRLQDLVPSIERGSNTVEMLDEVVEYVKHLQLQVEELSQTVVHLKESKRAMHPD